MDWCKLKLYPKQQWVSENTFGFARFIRYFYAIFITDLVQRDITIQNAFLLLRKLLNSWSVMMSNLLGVQEKSITQMDLSIWMFLTATHYFFEIYSQEKSKSDFWIKGNFASLLNLPKQVEKIGPLRLYWDGNNERFVQISKNSIENLRKTESYLSSKMTTMHKLNMIRYYKDIINPPQNRQYKYGFRSFQNRNDTISCLENGKVLSGFMLKDYDDQIHFVYNSGQRTILNFILVTFEDKINFQMECGVNFYSLRIIEHDINEIPKSHIYEFISQNVVILPYMKQNCSNLLQFTVVGEDYTVLRKDATVDVPEYCIDLHN